MRRLFLLFSFFSFIHTSGQVLPNYVPTDSLVGWWPFSGNANDISGNGLNGTVYNSPSLVSDRFGNANSAYSFNWTGASYGGNWQKIELPTTVTTGEFTINAWIKPSDYCWPNNSIKSAMIIGGSAQCTNTYGDLRFALSGNDGSLGFRHNGVNGISDTGLIQLLDWQMATLVVNNDSVTIYVDGNKSQSFSHNFSPGFNTCLSVGLHHQGNGHWYYFNGAIDDLGIWNKALSECEIQNLYNSNLGSCMVGEVSDTTICAGDSVTLSTITTYPCSYLPQNLRNGMKAWYPFCGSGQDEVLDNDIISTISLTADRNGKPLSAANIQSSYLELPHKSYHDNDDITFAFWVYNGNTSGRRSYLKKGIYSNAAMEDYYFGIDNNNKFISGFKGNNSCIAAQGWSTNLSSSSFDNTSNWTHLVFSHVNDTVRIYRNGIEEIKYYLNEPHGFCGAAPLFFGTEWSSYPTLAGGVIDDIGIWNRRLTPNEVSQLYNFSLGNDFTSILWSTGDTTSTINVSPSSSTKYWVRQIAGTDTIVDTITVNVLDPTINASTNSLCNPGDSVMLWVSSDTATGPIACGNLPGGLQNGLVAWYPFCGNANDESSIGNNGTVYGATLTTDRNGNPNSAYDFNGGSYIEAQNNAALNFTSSHTYSVWVRITGSNTWQHFITRNDGASHPLLQQFYLRRGSGGSIELQNSPNGNIVHTANTLNSTNPQWHHIVAVVDVNALKSYLYLDGVKIDSSSLSTPLNYNNNNGKLWIGVENPIVSLPSGPQYFQGKLDDIGIWNRALTQSEITQLYNGANSSSTLWSTAETTDTIWINPNSDTTIWVSTTLGNVTCVDSIDIDFLNPEIQSNILGICAPGDTAMLWVENESHSVTWSTGETSDTIFVTPVAATSYWVQFTSFNGVCSDTIEIDASEPIEIFGDSLLCKGDSLLLYTIPTQTSNIQEVPDSLIYQVTKTFGQNWQVDWSISSNDWYFLEVSGLWNLTSCSNHRDAAYWTNVSCLNNSQHMTPYTLYCAGGHSSWWIVDSCDQRPINDVYSTSHVYLYKVRANDGSLTLKFFDDLHSDNGGSLTFKLYSIKDSSITASNPVNWSNGESSDSIWVTPTQTTTYWVSSTDQYGCESTDSITVFVSDIQSTISFEEPSCNGSSDGQAQINPTGGITPYTFLWSNGSGSSMANNLSSDTVWVAVTDSIGCSAVDTFFIDQPDSLIISNIQTSNYNGFNVSCNGGSDGSVSTTVIGGTMPYYYNWNNNTYTTSGISNVGAGTYVLQVTDTNGCTVNETIVLAEPNPIIISPSITSNYNGYAISCYGESDGSADVNISGGIAPYSILWSNGVPTASITNVPSGNYSVIITDDNGCVDSAQINLNQPNPLSGTAVITNASCYGNADGSLNLSLSGGAGSYNVFWNTGDTSLSLNSLTTGWYTYSVISSNNCVLHDSVFLNQPTPLSIELDTIHPTCINSFDGELNIVAMGGTPGYNYYLNGNAFNGNIGGLGTDSLRILAVDFNNCDTLFVIAMPPVRDPCMFIPNWFSPNSNGKEDIWLIEGFEYDQLMLRIFNVYGQELYYTESQNYVPWDGTYNGKDLPNGDYYYVIESENNLSQYTGYVTLLR